MSFQNDALRAARIAKETDEGINRVAKEREERLEQEALKRLNDSARAAVHAWARSVNGSVQGLVIGTRPSSDEYCLEMSWTIENLKFRGFYRDKDGLFSVIMHDPHDDQPYYVNTKIDIGKVLNGEARMEALAHSQEIKDMK